MDKLKILAIEHKGEIQPMTCAISGRAFNQQPGLKYVLGGQVISPAVAHSHGFVMSPEIKPPETIHTKVALGAWLKDSLGLPRTSTHYRDIYGKYSPLYPLSDNNNTNSL